MNHKVGTILNYNQLPDVSYFPFVISRNNKNNNVKKGLFVFTQSIEGFLIGIVEKIVLLNEYFSDALTVKAYNANNNPDILKGLFPSEEFEFAIGIVKSLGVIEFEDDSEKKIQKINRMTYPATPGADVFKVNKKILGKFLGLDEQEGLYLGKMKVENKDCYINMDRLLNKHFGILSISGGGKSYLTSILIEEILMREIESGCPSIILIDVHGEYSYLKEVEAFKDKINIQDTTYFQISIPKLSPYTFRKYQEKISYVQIRELSKYIKKLKNTDEMNYFSIEDIISIIEKDETGNKSTKQALIGWLLEMKKLNLFGPQENPNLNNILEPNKLTIFNLQKEINIKKKQIIVDYICNRLFYLRRIEKIPPFLLILEEAHQFCPEAAQSKAISKSIIETIAREGRKFMACLCLISQRPKRLSTTSLSQLNSKMILNIKNPYDLKHLMDSSEAINKEYADMISTLGVGEMLLMGNAINYPIFINVRERKFKSKKENISLKESCKIWYKNNLNQNSLN